MRQILNNEQKKIMDTYNYINDNKYTLDFILSLLPPYMMRDEKFLKFIPTYRNTWLCKYDAFNSAEGKDMIDAAFNMLKLLKNKNII